MKRVIVLMIKLVYSLQCVSKEITIRLKFGGEMNSEDQSRDEIPIHTEPNLTLEKDIQHHIRNPLQAIIVLLEGVRLECKDEENVEPYITRIKKQVTALSGYLDSLPAKFEQYKDDDVDSTDQ